MAARRKIALIYNYNEYWIGGTYYIQNLVASLNHLPKKDRPYLTIISNGKKNVDDLKRITGYSRLSYRPMDGTLNFFSRVTNKISRLILKRNLISPDKSGLEIIFPIKDGECLADFSNARKPLFWIPDLQEHFLPDFFTEEEIKRRVDFQMSVVNVGQDMVFSSEAARKDFNEVYPENNLNQHILRFAVSHPADAGAEVENVLAKYQIPSRYLICSNQFWKHKNHQVILKAIHEVKKHIKEIFVVFTGKEYDYRYPHYFEELKDLAAALGINDNVRFLGFMDRKEQLALMKYSMAVIQPSLFEGWSTVVEDSKSIGATLIVSDIDVHKEQLENYSLKSFFPPLSEQRLSELIIDVLKNGSKDNTLSEYDYLNDVKKFAETFNAVLNKL